MVVLELEDVRVEHRPQPVIPGRLAATQVRERLGLGKEPFVQQSLNEAEARGVAEYCRQPYDVP